MKRKIAAWMLLALFTTVHSYAGPRNKATFKPGDEVYTATFQTPHYKAGQKVTHTVSYVLESCSDGIMTFKVNATVQSPEGESKTADREAKYPIKEGKKKKYADMVLKEGETSQVFRMILVEEPCTVRVKTRTQSDLSDPE